MEEDVVVKPKINTMFLKKTFGRVDEQKRIVKYIERGANFYVLGERMSGKSHLFRYICKTLVAGNIPFESFNAMPTVAGLRTLYEKLAKETSGTKYRVKEESELKGNLLLRKLIHLVQNEYSLNGKPIFYLVIDEFVLDPVRVEILNTLGEVFRFAFMTRQPVYTDMIRKYRCFYNLKAVKIDELEHSELKDILDYMIEEHSLNLEIDHYEYYVNWLRRCGGLPGIVVDSFQRVYDSVVKNQKNFTLDKLIDILEESKLLNGESAGILLVVTFVIMVFLGYQNASVYGWLNRSQTAFIYISILVAMRYFYFIKGKR